MIFIMLGSTFAIIIDSLSNEGSKGNNKIEYNGYEFIENNGFWITKLEIITLLLVIIQNKP